MLYVCYSSYTGMLFTLARLLTLPEISKDDDGQALEQRWLENSWMSIAQWATSDAIPTLSHALPKTEAIFCKAYYNCIKL